MTMDCPRCGFSQPKDRFCAQCGLDVDAYLLRPTPLLTQLRQNSGLPIFGGLLAIALAVGYILFSRVDVVSREVTELLGGTPLPAFAPKDPPKSASAGDVKLAAAGATEAKAEVETPGALEDAGAADDEETDETTPEPASLAAAAPAPQKIELNFYEVAREPLAPLLSGADRNGQGREGRAYIVRDATKLFEFIKTARTLTTARTLNLQAGAQNLVVTPPNTPEAFQFGLSLQVTKWADDEATLQWNSQLSVPVAEGGNDAVAPAAAGHAALTSSLGGTAELNSLKALVVVIEPPDRHPREEFVLKAGEGPWSIFASDDFRSGQTDWIAVVRLK